MVKPLTSVIVVSSASDGMAEVARVIVDELTRRGYATFYRNAAETLIPHLAGGALLIFGAAEGESLSAGDYRELYRSLKGVNFAGRYGAFFSVGSGGVFKDLSAMVKDTDLLVVEPGLVLSPGREKAWNSAAADWLSGIEKKLQGVPRK